MRFQQVTARRLLSVALALLLALPLGAQRFQPSRARSVVLTYHDVIEKRDAKALWFDCTAQELTAQLAWMTTRGVHFITLDQLYSHLTRGTRLPAKPVAITFADNYQGFWDRAYPILKARRVPVAMFVHTGYVGDRSHGRPKMDWNELRELDREGLVTIASQTVSHPLDLGKLSRSRQLDELKRSRETLRKELGHDVRYLAYPNGKFSRESMKLAKEAGYLMAFSEVTQPVERSPGLYAINRYVHTKYRQAVEALR